jgi:hypothetical protein
VLCLRDQMLRGIRTRHVLDLLRADVSLAAVARPRGKGGGGGVSVVPVAVRGWSRTNRSFPCQ